MLLLQQDHPLFHTYYPHASRSCAMTSMTKQLASRTRPASPIELRKTPPTIIAGINKYAYSFTSAVKAAVRGGVADPWPPSPPALGTCAAASTADSSAASDFASDFDNPVMAAPSPCMCASQFRPSNLRTSTDEIVPPSMH
mmetsp:Transcript_16092/g.32262  ORF Transcript_16092/g.32262 Transcript_16092/m.32262 type:complete len:141 (+) Transcript_16092:112-534(+)